MIALNAAAPLHGTEISYCIEANSIRALKKAILIGQVTTPMRNIPGLFFPSATSFMIFLKKKNFCYFSALADAPKALSEIPSNE